METLDPRDLIVIDESGCHFNMTLSHARTYGGDRIHMPINFNKGPKISVIGAISINKVEAAMYGEWNTNGEIFTGFAEHFLAPKLSKGKIVIMDNINFHKNLRATEIIESTGAEILFLPPYSPELSPIENMWSKIKQILRASGPRTWSEFKKEITNAFLEITKSDLIGWFKHCGYNQITI